MQRDLALTLWAHSPKVGGSNPPPATNAIIGLQVFRLQAGGQQNCGLPSGNQGCSGSLFYFASLRAGRSAIRTTLLLAWRFDFIKAFP
jgi:hypothetical protein